MQEFYELLLRELHKLWKEEKIDLHEKSKLKDQIVMGTQSPLVRDIMAFPTLDRYLVQFKLIEYVDLLSHNVQNIKSAAPFQTVVTPHNSHFSFLNLQNDCIAEDENEDHCTPFPNK